MEIKVNLDVLNEIIHQNQKMRTLLFESEQILAYAQRRLPMSKEYDHVAQHCANIRGLIEIQFKKMENTQKENQDSLDCDTIDSLRKKLCDLISQETQNGHTFNIKVNAAANLSNDLIQIEKS